MTRIEPIEASQPDLARLMGRGSGLAYLVGTQIQYSSTGIIVSSCDDHFFGDIVIDILIGSELNHALQN